MFNSNLEARTLRSKTWQAAAGIVFILVMLFVTACAPAATQAANTSAPAATAVTVKTVQASSTPVIAANVTQAVNPTATQGSSMPAGRTGGSTASSTTATPKYKDVAYASLSAAQKLDVYLPTQGSGPFPLVILVHGGAFMMGDKADASGTTGIDQLLSAGYAVAGVNYRLSSEAKAPAQIQDIKAAVRFLRAHAKEYNLNADKFGTWGASAGGSLVALLGTSCGAAVLEGADLGNSSYSSCVQAVVDWFGPIDFLTMDQQFTGTSCPVNHNDASSPESQLVGAAIQTKTDLVKAVNAITYVTAKAPAFLIQHGTADCNVPPQQSQQLYDALKLAIGADKVTLTFIQGAGHGGSQFSDTANMKIVIDFLDKYLK